MSSVPFVIPSKMMLSMGMPARESAVLFTKESPVGAPAALEGTSTLSRPPITSTKRSLSGIVAPSACERACGWSKMRTQWGWPKTAVVLLSGPSTELALLSTMAFEIAVCRAQSLARSVLVLVVAL